MSQVQNLTFTFVYLQGLSVFVCLFTSQYGFSPISMDLHSSGWMRKSKILTLVIVLLNVMSCLQMSVAEDKLHFWRKSCVREGVVVLVVSCCLLSCCPIQGPRWSQMAVQWFFCCSQFPKQLGMFNLTFWPGPDLELMFLWCFLFWPRI